MADDDKALVLARPPPKLRIARDLASATPDMAVYADRHGNVRSPWRLRALLWGQYGVLAALLASLFAGGSFVVGGAFTLFSGIILLRNQRLRAAGNLLRADRADDAIPILESLRRSRLGARGLRSLAEHFLARAHLHQGRFAPALEHVRRAQGGYRQNRTLWPMLAAYDEVTILVGLDRLAEAREVFERRARPEPTGDYLQVVHWTTELHLCLAEGDHRWDDDHLHAVARTALGISSATALIALTAWAHHRRGDLDQAHHLLREALDRPTSPWEPRVLPRLHAWIEAHRAEVAEAAEPES